MTEKLGVGVIGLMTGCKMLHVNHHRGKFRSEIRGVCDIRKDRLAQCASEFSVFYSTSDWRELIKRDDIDVSGACHPQTNEMNFIINMKFKSGVLARVWRGAKIKTCAPRKINEGKI